MAEESSSTVAALAKLKPDVRAMVRVIMLTAEYRAAENSFQKVDILRNSEFNIPVADACTSVGISTKTYYKDKKLNELGEPPLEKKSPNQLLTDEEESVILDRILDAQLKSECMCGQDVRDLASELYKKRTDVSRVFDRYWFRAFLRRHAELISKKKCPSVDDERGSLSREQIEQYIIDINNALAGVTDLRLVLNMDETGFGKRPDYGKKKSCVYVVNCDVEPVWRATTETHHISWVACISAAGTCTRHLMLSTRKKLDPEASKTFLPIFTDYFPTKKGYMTTESMIYWVSNILAPYVIGIRQTISNPEHPLVLIMDGLNQHFDDSVMAEFAKLSPFTIIPLPAHSSHITQPCDGCIFGLAKTRYKKIGAVDGYPALTAKMLRIKKTIQQCLTEENIVASWAKCGFEITINDGICTNIRFKSEFAEFLRSEVDGPEAQKIASEFAAEIREGK